MPIVIFMSMASALLLLAASVLAQTTAMRFGRVAPGFLADLVAVEGDPLGNIDAAINGVRWVMKEGRVVVDKTAKAPV